MRNYKLNTKRTFDKQAKIYDDSICSMYPRKCYKSVINEIKKLKYKKILDVGCGTGEILNRIADNKENYYGIDLSDKMIDIAKSKNNSINVNYLVGDSEFLPFPDSTFDVVFCVESFHHYPNPEAVIKEFYRVLADNGTLIICDMYRKAPLRQFYNFLMKIVNTGDVKIYTQNEITNLLNKKFDIEKYYFSTKQTYMCVSKKRSKV